MRELVAKCIGRVRVSGIITVLFLIAGAGSAIAEPAAHVRWDILNLSPLSNLGPGGFASATANDGSTITLTGSGTFVAPSGNAGTSSAATGGGTWTACSLGHTGCTSGTYQVAGLVRWEQAPGTPNASLTDLIGDSAHQRAGLAVLRITYSDGDRGILVVSSLLDGTPGTVFEGITASKGFVDYWEREFPQGDFSGFNANRTLFHVQP